MEFIVKFLIENEGCCLERWDWTSALLLHRCCAAQRNLSALAARWRRIAIIHTVPLVRLPMWLLHAVISSFHSAFILRTRTPVTPNIQIVLTFHYNIRFRRSSSASLTDSPSCCLDMAQKVSLVSRKQTGTEAWGLFVPCWRQLHIPVAPFRAFFFN